MQLAQFNYCTLFLSSHRKSQNQMPTMSRCPDSELSVMNTNKNSLRIQQPPSMKVTQMKLHFKNINENIFCVLCHVYVLCLHSNHPFNIVLPSMTSHVQYLHKHIRFYWNPYPRCFMQITAINVWFLNPRI